MGMLIDYVKCEGCEACLEACIEQNDLPEETELQGLSTDRFTTLTELEDQYVRKLCMHCIDPACASACPSAAMKKRKDGPVVYDASICLGCRYCMVACPFDIPKFEWGSNNPAVSKCIMCWSRLDEGKPTACAEACEYEATVFGEREELLELAKKRMKESPEEYHPRIFGEKEAGGTSVLLLTKPDYPFGKLGFPDNLPRHTLPSLTLSILRKLPGIVLVTAAGLTGLYWFFKRRDKVLALEEKERRKPLSDKSICETHGGDKRKKTLRERITIWRVILGIIVLTGLVFTVFRFWKGLGATTNLTDRTPWGLWVGLDVFSGVGLAAGGFTIACIVYIFNIKSLKPVTRPAILTAFIGYILVIAGLLFDMGRPYNIWRPIFHWNLHSVLFEVALCVVLYSVVLFLEFLPSVFEKFGWERLLKIHRFFLIPLVITGVLLSVLHQSSLGSMFVIFPEKMHGLWYSMLQPVLFFISCVAAGLTMVIIESYLSHRFLHRSLHTGILNKLAVAAAAIIGLYAAVRFADLIYRGALGLAFTPGYEMACFWGEIILGITVPMVLLGSRLRFSRVWMFVGALSYVLGFILHRMDTAITSLRRATGEAYFPSFMEIMISIFLIALGFIAFRLISACFPVFPKEGEGEERVN